MDICIVIRPNQYSIKSDLRKAQAKKGQNSYDINKMSNKFLKRMATKIRDDSHEFYNRGLVYIELGQYNLEKKFKSELKSSIISKEIETSLKLEPTDQKEYEKC